MVLSMNVTDAQLRITHRLIADAKLSPFLQAMGTGVCAFAVAAGIGGIIQAACLGTRSTRKRGPLFFTAVIAVAAFLMVADERRWVWLSTRCYSDFRGLLYLKALVLISAFGWLQGGFRIRWRYGLYALAVLIPVSMRSKVWDTYLIEVILFGLLGVSPAMIKNCDWAQAETPLHIWPKLALMAVAAFHLTFVLHLKFKLDRADSLCVLSEESIRVGKLKPEDISFAPFGLIGWYWNPYFVSHEGRAHKNNLGLFYHRYLNRGAVEVVTVYSPALQMLPGFNDSQPSDKAQLIDMKCFRFAWFFKAQYFLLRAPAAKTAPALVRTPPGSFKPEAFPLNDNEWRQSILRINRP